MSNRPTVPDNEKHAPSMNLNQLEGLFSRTLTCCHGLVEQLTQVDLRQTLGPELRDRISRPSEPQSCDFRGELASLLTRACPSGAEAIDPTWFVSFPARPDADGTPTGSSDPVGAGSTPLAERVLEFLPIRVRDPVALLLGGTVRAAGRLPTPAAAEVARKLWGRLAPMPTREKGDAITDLPLRSAEALERSIRKLGARLAGLLLSAVPERAAAALCQKLPPEEATEVWLHRRTAGPDRPPLGSLKEGAKRLSENPPAQTVPRLGSLVLARALQERPGLVRQVAQRLPRSLGRMVLTADAERNRRSESQGATPTPGVPDRGEAARWLLDILE